ncbi:tRNA pseudouridine synthase A [Georgenia sp. Z1344]|uniref:tRNA pseudouridine synthase A n=1 Tax=Georgenia sp. Z1344 TaxID=3416706 RepID=UPI003CEDEEF5
MGGAAPDYPARVESEPPVDPVRVRLDLAYDGTDFSGWAAQPGLRTVEGELTAALTTVLRVPGLRLTVAGRTDAGVHAHHQVAHVDVPREAWDAVPGRSGRTPGEALVARLAGVLAKAAGGPRGSSDVVVRGAAPAPDGFDARFSATWRSYRYRVSDAAATRDPGRRGTVLWHPRPLDERAMARAATGLVGEHDFLSYCRPREGATTIRTLESAAVERAASGADAGLLVLSVRADAFCHSMVRSLAGALLAVGEGRRDPGWPAEALALRSRTAGVDVAPAHGLTLEEVGYPDDSRLAVRAAAARRVRTLEE